MAPSDIPSDDSAPKHADITERKVDEVERNLYESFGEVATLAASLLRDWPDKLDGQHKELRRLAEDIGVHLPTCREETAAAGYVLIRCLF